MLPTTRLWLLIAAVATTARAQFVGGTQEGDLASELCNKTFADANATGIFSFDPAVVQGDQEGQPDNNQNFALPASWGVTVFDVIGGDSPSAEFTAWYSTNGANYSDSAGLYYDVCVLILSTPTNNARWRAADDDGTCSTIMDEPCTTALKEQSAALAYGLVENPTPDPGSNLTQGSLGRVCYDVGNMMTESFPKECNAFFNGSAAVYGSPMTSFNESWVDTNCTIEDDNGQSFAYATSVSFFTSAMTEQQQEIVYANLTQAMLPLLTVFLPLADVNRESTISAANSILTCPHINQINPSSLQPATAPTPTPEGSSGISGGAIAGIVIGVIAGIALVLAGVYFFWWRKRKTNTTKGSDQDHSSAYATDHKYQEMPQDAGQVNELSAVEHFRPELPTQKSGPTVELPGDGGQYKGLEGPPAELPAQPKY